MESYRDLHKQLIDYYGGFTNDHVSREVLKELAFVKPEDLDRLYYQILESLPAGWKPDYMAIKKAIKECGIVLLHSPNTETICPVCGTRQYSTGGLCNLCMYDFQKHDDPDEHRKYWEMYKRGELQTSVKWLFQVMRDKLARDEKEL